MKVCDKMDWDVLPPRNAEVTVMTKKGEIRFGGSKLFFSGCH